MHSHFIHNGYINPHASLTDSTIERLPTNTERCLSKFLQHIEAKNKSKEMEVFWGKAKGVFPPYNLIPWLPYTLNNTGRELLFSMKLFMGVPVNVFRHLLV